MNYLAVVAWEVAAAEVAGAEMEDPSLGASQDRVASSHNRLMTLVVPAPVASSKTNFFATRSLLLLSLSSK